MVYHFTVRELLTALLIITIIYSFSSDIVIHRQYKKSDLYIAVDGFNDLFIKTFSYNKSIAFEFKKLIADDARLISLYKDTRNNTIEKMIELIKHSSNMWITSNPKHAAKLDLLKSYLLLDLYNFAIDEKHDTIQRRVLINISNNGIINSISYRYKQLGRNHIECITSHYKYSLF